MMWPMWLQLVKIAKVLGTDDLFAYLDKVGRRQQVTALSVARTHVLEIIIFSNIACVWCFKIDTGEV